MQKVYSTLPWGDATSHRLGEALFAMAPKLMLATSQQHLGRCAFNRSFSSRNAA